MPKCHSCGERIEVLEVQMEGEYRSVGVDPYTHQLKYRSESNGICSYNCPLCGSNIAFTEEQAFSFLSSADKAGEA